MGVWLAAGSVAQAEPLDADRYWPQWRGPRGTGASPHADPPIEWSETENVAWKVRIAGSGTSTPIVWGDQVFLQTAIDTGRPAEPAPQVEPPPPGADAPAAERPRAAGRFGRGGRSAAPGALHQFLLVCLDRRTGQVLWQHEAREEVPHEGHHQDHGFASCSPVTDGECVISYFGSRGVHCYDLAGNKKWEQDLGNMQTKNSFGEGSSPALWGKTVVVNWDHEGEDFIVALHRDTGQELWRQPRDEDTSWATPLVVEHGDRVEVVTAATRRIRSYDLATGALVWECSGLTPNAIPSPVAAGGMVFATSGFRGNALLAIRLGAMGDITGTDAIAWSHGRSTPYVPSPLLSDGRLYFFSGNNGILSCFDAREGRPLFGPERLNDLRGVYASPVAAAGRVYLVGRDGAAIVIKCSDQLEILATNRLDERFDASPVAVGRQLLLRGHEYLYCLEDT